MSVELPVLPLPETYTWGFVVARSIHAMADTEYDEDRFPEARGSTGRVTFTPVVRFNKHTNTPTAFVQYEIVTARLQNGELIDAGGHEGIYLISGVYDVSFMIDGGSIPSFRVEVFPSHTKENPLDLVLASPYEPPPEVIVRTFEIPPNAGENEFLSWRNGRLVWVKSAMGTDSAVNEVLSDPTSTSHQLLLSNIDSRVPDVPLTALENLVMNPRGRNTSGTVTIQENLVHNPSFEYGLGSGWSVSGASASYSAFHAGLMWDEEYEGGPGRQGGLRMVQMIADEGRNHYYLIQSSSGYFAVTPGETLSLRALVAADTSVEVFASIQYRDTDGNFAVLPTLQTPYIRPAWYKGAIAYTSGVVPEGATTGRVVIWARTWNKDEFGGTERLWVDDVLVVRGLWDPSLYFDGDYSYDDDFTPEWTGTPGASTSRLVAPRPVGWQSSSSGLVYYSAEKDAVALRVNSDHIATYAYTNIGGVQDAKYTALTEVIDVPPPKARPLRLAAYKMNPNYEIVTGPVTLRRTETETRDNRNMIHLAISNSSGNMHDIGTTVYFRAAAHEGTYSGLYFDGHTDDTDITSYIWAGSEDNSTSAATALVADALRYVESRLADPETVLTTLSAALPEEARKALDITTDTSVGTRVFVGDVMIHGSTGERDIRDLLDPADWIAGTRGVRIWRDGQQVGLEMQITRVAEGGTRSSLTTVIHLPLGFAPIYTYFPVGSAYLGSDDGWLRSDNPSQHLRVRNLPGTWSPGDNVMLSGSWITRDPWPTALPGTPA